jgi:ubiquinone biosynthesis accessory factor UbiK
MLKYSALGKHISSNETLNSTIEMINKEHIEEFIQQASKLVPDDLSRFKKEIETNLRTTLSASLSKMDLVTREEYDIQTALLQRTRAQLDALQEKLSALEKQSGVTNT